MTLIHLVLAQIRMRAGGHLIAAVMVFVSVGNLQAADKKLDPVVAIVNGFEFHMSDISRARRQLPPQAQQYPVATVYNFLLNNLVNTRLVAAAARKEGLDKEADVSKQIHRLEDQILHQEYLAKRVAGAVTEKRLKDSYQTYVKNNPVGEEVRARHILVQTREQAMEVIGRLNKGEDFAALARTVSTGPSGKQGGDLGYFTAGRMVPAFSAAAFSIRPGTFTAKPVKTQFGWHIIKVEDKRSQKPKSFEEVQAQLRDRIAKELSDAVVAELRKAADVKTFGMDGK
ncbi:MAG: peptidylprolyl isomerase [Rhodospirillaceae bacterium]|mgnify:CR=1 FL=1|jgi:peptidyl-prolyl cis-trans isomerase C|nr:peptidylprolyl isomerase [Rhodospirillaceae bacterium]MBT7954990.1 peptidylprolyl isomerase [Rhodospirillaceae bacterium]